jgi:hypothetical protein
VGREAPAARVEARAAVMVAAQVVQVVAADPVAWEQVVVAEETAVLEVEAVAVEPVEVVD